MAGYWDRADATGDAFRKGVVRPYRRGVSGLRSSIASLA